MTKLQYEAGSFRDPAGRVFYHNNEVYREIKKAGLKNLEAPIKVIKIEKKMRMITVILNIGHLSFFMFCESNINLADPLPKFLLKF